MVREIKARFFKGVLRPEEALDLAEGAEVTVLVPDVSGRKPIRQALSLSAGSWEGLIDAEELKRAIHEDRKRWTTS